MSPATSSRWCPTPEQLMILEELYRSGIRTPNASQIQHITTHLSFYGRIEGKNVFYWFQNHKARERQKLRRKLGKQLQQQHQLYHHHHQPNHSQLKHHLLHYFDSRASSPLQQFSCFSPVRFLPQGGQSENAPQQMMNHTWKVNIPESRAEIGKSLMGMYGRDWIMMMDAAAAPPPSPSCCASRPPLKTLQLFPITATNLKEECNSDSSNKHLSCNTTINN
ncbi:hypothetical protein Patl1_30815 [Pistacia atlantica]|uniref:Uncharacterized protein n=1 Tax=Pistacia atlantica TaxID=434234 RepID=A0ACC1AAW2_9ROSI|nr:hypothetical protein Patl1_30815 [Pistacia atlantica]